MSAIDFAKSGTSTATVIQSFGTPLIQKAIERVGTYLQITSDAIAENNTRNVKEMTDQPIVDLFGQIGIVKGLQIDISV